MHRRPLVARLAVAGFARPAAAQDLLRFRNGILLPINAFWHVR
jgi:hypothetical protein